MDERLLKIVEWETGRVMAVRSDFTPQIARLAGGLLRHARPPFRFCYFGPVLKFDLRRGTKKHEEVQVGAELIGPGGAGADGEIIELCVSLLRDAGLRGFVVQLGDVRFLRAVTQGASARALGKKEWPALKLGGLVGRRSGAAPALEGPSSILRSLAGRVKSAAARKVLSDLGQTARRINRRRSGFELRVDLGEVRDLHYYTGAFFQVFHPSASGAVAAGGRYDRLLSRFGHSHPATGFALDLRTLSGILSGPARSTRHVPRLAGSRFA